VSERVRGKLFCNVNNFLCSIYSNSRNVFPSEEKFHFVVVAAAAGFVQVELRKGKDTKEGAIRIPQTTHLVFVCVCLQVFVPLASKQVLVLAFL